MSSSCNLSDYLREYVYEEYAAFLLPRERLHKFNYMENSSGKKLLFENIKSERVKAIAEDLGIRNEMTEFAYNRILTMIGCVEEPFVEKGKIVFPIVKLEEAKDRSYEDYAKVVINSYSRKNSLLRAGRNHGFNKE